MRLVTAHHRAFHHPFICRGFGRGDTGDSQGWRRATRLVLSSHEPTHLELSDRLSNPSRFVQRDLGWCRVRRRRGHIEGRARQSVKAQWHKHRDARHESRYQSTEARIDENVPKRHRIPPWPTVLEPDAVVGIVIRTLDQPCGERNGQKCVVAFCR
jgi:hypothetical protein